MDVKNNLNHLTNKEFMEIVFIYNLSLEYSPSYSLVGILRESIKNFFMDMCTTTYNENKKEMRNKIKKDLILFRDYSKKIMDNYEKIGDN